MVQLILISHWFIFWCLFEGPFHVYALPSDAAQQTIAQQIVEYQGANPAPTTAPTISERDLLPRQNQGQICGFANADINSAIMCEAGYECAINPYNYAAGCCIDPYYCEYHTACVPYISMDNCGAACQSNVYVTKCADAAQPYCYVRLYELSEYSYPFYEVDCNSEPGTQTVYQSYTNNVAQSITPQLLIITTTASSISTTTTENSQPTGGTVVQCGNGGSNGGSGSGGGSVTCNVGGGNNGDGNKTGLSPTLDEGIMVHALIWWVGMELFRWALL